MLFFLVHLLFYFLIVSQFFSKNNRCLKIPSIESCLSCLSSYYERSYPMDLKIASTKSYLLLDSDCILRENIKNNRTIYILNSDCPDCKGDAIYFDLPTAFVEESKIAARYLNCSLFQ